METMVIYPKDKRQAKVLGDVFKEMNVRFEMEEPYNKKFVKKILESKAQANRGEFKIIKTDDLWK